MATILIVEDNENMQILTATRLKSYFDIICACDGLEALCILMERHIDLIVADVMMPHLDGYGFLKQLRAEGNQTPVLLLTAKQSFEDKREGFLSGTDDYMTKPVNYEELLLRIQALLRRSRISSERKLTIGSVTVDSAAYSVMKDTETLELSKKEFDLLYKLLSYPGMIFTKNQLLDEIWGYDSISGEETVKTHISRLRNKLKACEEFEILTVKGLGYKAEIVKQP